jgi:hypothetical protein
MNAVQSVVAKFFRKPNGNLPTRQHSVALDDGCSPPAALDASNPPLALDECDPQPAHDECDPAPRIDNFAAAEPCWVMTDQKDDPLAQFGLDAIDLRWTLKDIASKRTLVINKDHLPKLMELGLVEMREGTPHLTTAGQIAAWQDQVG